MADGFIAFGAEFVEAFDLGKADRGIVHVENVDGIFLGEAVFVDADDGFLAGVDAGLAAGGGFLDAHFRDACFDGLGHAAEFLGFRDMGPRAVHEFVGEGFEIIGAAPWVDHAADGGFILQKNLGVAGDAGGEIGGQGDGLVERVGMQRLGVAEGGGHGFDAGAGNVVERVLFC